MPFPIGGPLIEPISLYL